MLKTAQQPMVTTSREWARTSRAVPSRWKAKSANSREKAPARAKCGARGGRREEDEGEEEGEEEEEEGGEGREEDEDEEGEVR